MPTYDYKCPDCNQIVEVFHGMNDDPMVVCRSCYGIMEKQIGIGACIQFNGSGFYETDYKPKPKEGPHEHNASPDSD